MSKTSSLNLQLLEQVFRCSIQICALTLLIILPQTSHAQNWKNTSNIEKQISDSIQAKGQSFFSIFQTDSDNIIIQQPIPELKKEVPILKPDYHQLGDYQGWIFLLGCFLIVVWHVLFPGYWMMLFLAIIKPNLLLEMESDEQFGFNFIHWLSDALTIVSITTTISMLWGDKIGLSMGWMLCLVVAVYFIKILFVQSLGTVFYSPQTGVQHLLYWLGCVRPLGVMLFLVSNLFLFMPIADYQIAIQWALIVFYLIGLLSVIRGMLPMLLNGFAQSIYLFIYLCTTEITPVLIIFKGILL